MPNKSLPLTRETVLQILQAESLSRAGQIVITQLVEDYFAAHEDTEAMKREIRAIVEQYTGDKTRAIRYLREAVNGGNNPALARYFREKGYLIPLGVADAKAEVDEVFPASSAES